MELAIDPNIVVSFSEWGVIACFNSYKVRVVLERYGGRSYPDSAAFIDQDSRPLDRCEHSTVSSADNLDCVALFVFGQSYSYRLVALECYYRPVLPAWVNSALRGTTYALESRG